MSQDDDALESREGAGTLAARTLGPSRMGVYTTLGALTGVVPLPWVPDAVVRQIRGTLAHEVATRHGLGVSSQRPRSSRRPRSSAASARSGSSPRCASA